MDNIDQETINTKLEYEKPAVIRRSRENSEVIRGIKAIADRYDLTMDEILTFRDSSGGRIALEITIKNFHIQLDYVLGQQGITRMLVEGMAIDENDMARFESTDTKIIRLNEDLRRLLALDSDGTSYVIGSLSEHIHDMGHMNKIDTKEVAISTLSEWAKS